jgi:transposase
MTMSSSSLFVRAHDGVVDEPDPAARPRRRSFTAEYKAEILDEYDALPVGSSERGALLRREGLYSSHLAEWRKARDAGARGALAPKSKPRRSAEQVELERLRHRNERLETELAKTRSALDVMGKLHALLEGLSESADTDPKSTR